MKITALVVLKPSGGGAGGSTPASGRAPRRLCWPTPQTPATSGSSSAASPESSSSPSLSSASPSSTKITTPPQICLLQPHPRLPLYSGLLTRFPPPNSAAALSSSYLRPQQQGLEMLCRICLGDWNMLDVCANMYTFSFVYSDWPICF